MRHPAASLLGTLCLFAPAVLAAPPQAVTVPLRLDHGVIFFDATLDGRGPFAFILDPGAKGAVSGDTLKRLGLKAGESAELDVAVGPVHLGKQSLLVIDGDGSDLYPKHDPVGPPIAGALGPEMLKGYALRVDYAHATLTLTTLDGFKYRGTGKPLAVTFHDVIPLITASADGVKGLFAYDLRAPGKLMLFHPFLERNGFLSRYGVAPDVNDPVVPVSLHTLGVAGVVLHEQPARFAGFTTGKFAATDEAGVLGYGVLSQFITTVDYRDKLIYFEPATSAP